MIIKEVSPEWFTAHIAELVIDALIHQNPRERAQHFTNIMDTARALDLEEQAEEVAQAIAKREGEPELWELPEPFEKPVELTGFPVSALPKALSDYLKEVARTVQVYPEMCALPLLSTLSLCVQGKACIQFPGNDHTEPLNIYTLTVASPGQRKTSCFSCFTAAVDNYVKRYNAIHSVEIQNNKAERAAIEKQINKEICSKNPDMDHIRELNEKLNSMDRLNELRMNVKDITPEALAWEMFLQNERIGILDDEGGVFDVLGGLYSGGQSNLSIFLEAYDGSMYSIIRRTKENITLNSPLLTIGLMTQPDHFENIMNNRQFSGRGLIQRFLFAFPGSRTGQQKLTTGTIDHDSQVNYIQLINKLLEMPFPAPGEETPAIICDAAAARILTEYFDMLQAKIRPGGLFENMVEWAAKHFARCMRIAGTLHLCEHSAADELNEQTAASAISIAVWAENHALKALSGEMNDNQETRDAKYILSRVKEKRVSELSKSELLRMCRRLKADEIEAPLELLEDHSMIKREFINVPKTRKPREIIKFNPLSTS